MIRRPPRSTRTDTLFPYTTRFRSQLHQRSGRSGGIGRQRRLYLSEPRVLPGRKSGIGPCFSKGLQLARPPDGRLTRSEEHTTELQSLMRISYAVFCLKTTKHKQIHTTQHISFRQQTYTIRTH